MSTFPCEISRDAPSVCLLPWQENPYRLVTLWDLVQAFKVDELFGAVRRLGKTLSLIEAGNGQINRKPIFAIVKTELGKCCSLCNESGLRMSALRIRQLDDSADALYTLSPEGSAHAAERMNNDVCISIENELSLYPFFSLAAERAKYYSEDDIANPFGEDVGKVFPSSTFDAIESCKCYALGRDTACVFHLMRVLEVGLGSIGARFNVSSDHTNWETVINRIEKAISDIDKDPNRPANWKDDREFYSQCASHFRFVKDAWRNYTAHARGKYLQEEAESILINVRGFMQKIATRP